MALKVKGKLGVASRAGVLGLGSSARVFECAVVLSDWVRSIKTNPLGLALWASVSK